MALKHSQNNCDKQAYTQTECLPKKENTQIIFRLICLQQNMDIMSIRRQLQQVQSMNLFNLNFELKNVLYTYFA